MHSFDLSIVNVIHEMRKKKTRVCVKKRKMIKSVTVQHFVLEALKSQQRIDTRLISDTRPIKISLEKGQSIVQLGKTKVLCHVSCEVVAPPSHNPTEGILLFNAQISSMSSPQPPSNSDSELLICRQLEKALKRSRAIDTEGLCILAGEKVWQIRIDVRILDDEGNMFDCACLAVMTALLNFKRPDVSLNGYDLVMHPEDEKVPIPLSIHHIPVSVTFAFFDNASIYVVDPSLLEEQAAESTMTVVLNTHREVCSLFKTGGSPISNEKLKECIHMASIKTNQITDLIKAALKSIQK